jgi:hypothetical protein
MQPLLTTLRRTLLVPALLPTTVLVMGLTWLGVLLAREGLGGSAGFVDEVRAACLPFAGALVLSLAEPLELRREARSGLLLLRAARGGGYALGRRWLGLLLATLPTVALTAWASGGAPADPLALLAELAMLCAGGLLLGAWLERTLLVPALWALLVAGHLWPWLDRHWLSWLLPRLGGPADGTALLAALCWSAGALLLARSRLAAVSARAG